MIGKDKVREDFYRVRAKLNKLDQLRRRLHDEVVSPLRESLGADQPERTASLTEELNQGLADLDQQIDQALQQLALSNEGNRLKERRLREVLNDLSTMLTRIETSFDAVGKNVVSLEQARSEPSSAALPDVSNIADLLDPLTTESERLHHNLEATFSKWRLFVEFQPRWQQLLQSVDDLKTELTDLLEGTRPPSEDLRDFMATTSTTGAETIESASGPDSSLGDEVQLPAKALAIMRRLQDVSTRSELHQELEAPVWESVTHLGQLAQSLQGILQKYRPDVNALRGVWHPLAEQLEPVIGKAAPDQADTEAPPPWRDDFESLQEEWRTSTESLRQTLKDL